MSMPYEYPVYSHVSVTIPRQFRVNPARLGLIALLTLMLVVTLMGGTARRAGAETPPTATVTAQSITVAPVASAPVLTTTATLSPEMARAIAYTAAVVAAQRADVWLHANGSIEGMIRARFAGTGQSDRAVRIARCESGLNPLSRNRRSTAFGLYQFLNSTWASTGIARTADAFRQVLAAFRLWKSRGWQPWVCR